MKGLQFFQMNQILTLQDLPDIDTFTLEEKIQQLQSHPNSLYYSQLIALAKLELDQRYKVEEFGRKLINDQIPILPQICFSKIKNHPKIEPVPSLPTDRTSKKFSFAQCLKRSLIPDEKASIGRSAVGNYRYISKAEPVAKKSKKSTSYNSTHSKKSIVSKKINENPKKSRLTSIASKETIESLPPIYKNTTPVKSVHVAAETVKESKKEQGKKIEIKYIQNDVYDGQLVLDKPLDLLKLAVEDKQAQQINESIYDEERQQQQQCEKQSEKDICEEIVIEKDKQISVIDRFNWEDAVNQQFPTAFKMQKSQQKYQCLDAEEIRQEKLQQRQQSAIYTQSLKEIKHQQQKNVKMMEQPQESIKIQQSNENGKKIKLNVKSDKKNTKSASLKILTKVNNQDQCIDEAVHIQMIDLNNKNNECKNSGTNGMIKTTINFSKLLSHKQNIKEENVKIITKKNEQIKYFNYNQFIPNFLKLFPHCCSGSIINDLRAIQSQLQDHLNKKITSMAMADQYLRIRDQELTFKVISECEKAKKYRQYFDIELDSFIERGKIMLSRIDATRDGSSLEDRQVSQKNTLLYRVVRQKEDVYDIVNSTFHRTKKWYELPHGMELKASWNLLWTWSRPQIDQKFLCYFQKVNHFFGNKQIARKDLLKKNIEKIKKLGKKAQSAFDIIPQTFYLPGENMQFVRKFRQSSLKYGDLNYWIMKPVGMSRGRGIELVNKIQDIVFNEPVVLQKYLMNPLLLDGYKFDLRIYVLVTSINPLEAYVYEEGFARISTHKYSTQEQDLSNKFIHLTNYSVQKQNIGEAEVPLGKTRKLNNITCMTQVEQQIGGCKITLKCLKDKLSPKIDWNTQVKPQIDSIVLKSLISTMNCIEPNPNCFELFGYDIMLDEDLKCWLIQVNSSPSLEKDFIIDEIVKQQLVDDIMQIVNPVSYDRKRLLQVVTRRRKQLQGFKSHINTGNNSVQQLNADLHYILHGKPLKSAQKCPTSNFKQVAPGKVYDNLIRLVQQYKIDSIVKKN